jgi:phenylpyruvate tautomerase
MKLLVLASALLVVSSLRVPVASTLRVPVASTLRVPVPPRMTTTAAPEPGDPSLILNVNRKLKDKKSFLQASSKAIAECFSKPEMYVAVCVNDDVDVLFGGSDDAAAVGCVYSIGAINQAKNGAVTAKLSALLLEHGGVADNRIYLNFFDVPRANCGWSSKTFAG